MNIETQTNPQGQAEATTPNPAEGGAQVPDGSQVDADDELAALLEHPELEQPAPPTGGEAGDPASGEPAGQAGEGDAAPGQEGQEPTPEAGAFNPINITYKGKAYTVDSAAKATELIQKGLDYQVKMARLGQERGKLQLLNQALQDPQRAEQLKGLLTGQGVGQGQSAAKPQGGDPELGQGILLPVEGPEGQKFYMPPDKGMVSLISQVVEQAMTSRLQALHKEQPQSGPDTDPYLGALVQEKKEADLARYIDATYPQRASWSQARDKVIEAMVADGIGPGHAANTDPNVWLNYYMRLSMANLLPSREDGGLTTKPKTVDKSALKAGAQTPKSAGGKPAQATTDDLVGRVLAPGASDHDWDAAIEPFFDHPGIKAA